MRGPHAASWRHRHTHRHIDTHTDTPTRTHMRGRGGGGGGKGERDSHVYTHAQVSMRPAGYTDTAPAEETAGVNVIRVRRFAPSFVQ
jgi:hypothetical protein